MPNINPTLNVPQANFLQLENKFRAFVAGFGSGKTWVGCSSLCDKSWEFPKVPLGYFAPTYPQIRDIFFPTIDEVAFDWGLKTKIYESNKEVDIYYGRQYRSTIICRSMEKPQTIVGFKIGHALIDELDVMPTVKAQQAWRKIIARMRVKHPGLINGIDVATTPEGFKFTHQQFVKEANLTPAKRALYGMIQASTYDNEANLPDDYISSLYESYPPQLISAYLRGQFVNLTSGAVYPDFDRKLNHTDEEIKSGEHLIIGMDFNVLKMAAVIYVIREGKPLALDEMVGVRDTPTMATLSACKKIPDYQTSHQNRYPYFWKKKMKGITSKHADYLKHINLWIKVDDVCEGQEAIKAKGKTYLPVPVTFGDGDEERFKEYLSRAVFYGVTGRTLNSHVGSAFNKLPDFKRPDDLEYLDRNADGSGRSIYQASQHALRLISKHYRCGVYVDYPQVAPSRNRAEDKLKNAFPMIHILKAASVEDWDHIIVGNQKKTSFVKIRESVATRSADGFGRKTKDQYRALRLEEGETGHVYTVQIYTQNEKGEWVEGVKYIPTDYHGKTWSYIPFTFCGAVDNTDEVGNAPLLELAEINLAHYRNSADVEESGFIVGQPIISMPDISTEQYKIIKEDGLAIGGRSGFPTKVEIVQAEQNNLAKALMTDKWAQMKEMGARLIEVGSANKTATQADNEDSVQHSVLSLAVSNISEAFQMALRWCAKFSLPNHDLSPDELNYVISQDFNKPKFSEERAKRLYEACVGGNLPWVVWYQYEQTGIFSEEKWEEIEKKIEQRNDGGVV